MQKLIAVCALLLSATVNADTGWLALNWQPEDQDTWITQLFVFDTNSKQINPVGGRISCGDIIFKVEKKTGLGICQTDSKTSLRALAYDEVNGLRYTGAAATIIPSGNFSFAGLDQDAPRILYRLPETSLFGFATPVLDTAGEILSVHRLALGSEWISDSWFYINNHNLFWREGQIPVADKLTVRIYQLWQGLPTGEMTLLRELRETTTSPGATQDNGSWPEVGIKPSTWLSDSPNVTVSRVANRWTQQSNYQPYQVTFTFERGNWTASSKAVTTATLRSAEASGLAFRKAPEWTAANPGSLILNGKEAIGMRLDSYTNPSKLLLFRVQDGNPMFVFDLPIKAARARPILLPKLHQILAQ